MDEGEELWHFDVREECGKKKLRLLNIKSSEVSNSLETWDLSHCLGPWSLVEIRWYLGTPEI
jgi:hypothetical protein